jgi:hypothetical protein
MKKHILKISLNANHKPFCHLLIFNLKQKKKHHHSILCILKFLQCSERANAIRPITSAMGGIFIHGWIQSAIFDCCDADNLDVYILLVMGPRVYATGLHWLAFQVQSAAGQKSSSEQLQNRQCDQSGAVQSTGGWGATGNVRL